MGLRGNQQLGLLLLLQESQPLEEALLFLQTMQDDFGMICALVEITGDASAPEELDFIKRFRAAAEQRERRLICISISGAALRDVRITQPIEKALGCKPIPILLRRDNTDDIRKAILKTLRLAG